MMDKTTYDYLQPTLEQIERMKRVREAAVFSLVLEAELPNGLDKDDASPDDGDVG